MMNEARTCVPSPQSDGAVRGPLGVGGQTAEDLLQVELCDHLEDRHLGHLRMTERRYFSPSGAKPIIGFRRC